MLALALALFFADFFLTKLNEYKEISQEGAKTFGFLATIPVLSFFGKFVFALLSPFPWYKAADHIDEIYGGNALNFVMHVLSALTGIYFFTRIIFNARSLARTYPDVKLPIVFGLIMSLSILGGAVAFHSYLVIFFPFFAPLFALSRYRVPWTIPLGIAVGCEALYMVSILFV